MSTHLLPEEITVNTHTAAEWLTATEAEIAATMQAEATARAEAEEWASFEKARVEAFCLDGNGHREFVVEQPEPAVGYAGSTYCRVCETVLS